MAEKGIQLPTPLKTEKFSYTKARNLVGKSSHADKTCCSVYYEPTDKKNIAYMNESDFTISNSSVLNQRETNLSAV